MDFAAHRKRTAVDIRSDSLQELYPHDLQLYTMPPLCDISLTEFEDLAIERLQVLRIVEQASLRGHKILSNEWKNSILQDLHKDKLKKYARLVRASGPSGKDTKATDLDLQARRADHISNFILQLAYCRSEELRRWFISREVDLFKMRFLELTPASVEYFLELNNLIYKPISHEEKDAIRTALIESTANVNFIDTVAFYKVPFREVTGLVKGRKVCLRSGFAYIPSSELVACIATQYKIKLSEIMAYTYRQLPQLDDERISELLNTLHSAYTGNEYISSGDKDGINLATINTLAKKNYPICMRHIHDTFKATSHMKHFCRLQYGLFTKGIGLSLEDALTFWRTEFTKKMDGEKFEKNYSYELKHQYGKVGSMINYSAFSCIKIISQNVGSGEHHGCPFRHFDPALLRQKLHEYGVSGQGINEISEIAVKGHFQIACGKYFEYIHGQPSKNVINHPNQYFEDSLALTKDKDKPGMQINPQNKIKNIVEKGIKVESNETDNMKIDESIFEEPMEF